jgi:hypothetical protein
MIKGWQKFGTMNPSFPRPSLSWDVKKIRAQAPTS